MAPTFIGNPYNNEITEDSDGIDDDDWDDLVGQFPLPVFPGDSTEEDNILYGNDDDDDDDQDEENFYHMIQDGGYGLEIADDDDEDYDPNDDSSLLSLSDDDIDFEPGPPITYADLVFNTSVTSVTSDTEDEDEDSISMWNMSTENIAASNVASSECIDETQPSLDTNDDVQKPSSETPSSSESVGETVERGGPDST